MIFFSLMFWLFSSNQFLPINSLTNLKNDKDEIVFIFKMQNKTLFEKENYVSVLGSDIYYTEENNFIPIDLQPNNQKTSDTITKSIMSTKICLFHLYNKTQKFLYEFQRGDTVVFTYDKGYPYVTVKNRKTLAYDNNFLADMTIEKPIDDFQFIAQNKRIRSTLEYRDYFKTLDNYNVKVEKTLDSLLKNKLLSESVYEMHKASNKFFKINTNKKLLVTITNDDLRKDNLLYLKTYRHFLNNYVVHRFKLKTQYENDPMSCNSKIAFDSVMTSSIFSNRVKESLLFAHLINIAESNSKNDFNYYFTKFKQEVKDTLLIEKVKKNYLFDFATITNKVNDAYFANGKKVKILWEDVLAKNNGKVIFVDFWASWCAPCRVAMPFSRKLSEEYKDRNVVFINVSIDTNFEQWKKASEKESLVDNDNNLIALNYPDANLFKALSLKTIPRYLIYDKKGKLVHKNAPSPQNNQIREELNKYLNE